MLDFLNDSLLLWLFLLLLDRYLEEIKTIREEDQVIRCDGGEESYYA